MELKQMDRTLLKGLYMVVAGIIITQVLGMDSGTSLMFYLTFPLTVFLWLRTIRKKLTVADVIVAAAAAIAVTSVLLNAAVTNTGISFSYLKKLIMFIMTLMFLQTSFRVKIDKDMSKFIIGISDFLVLFFIASYFIFGREMYILNGRVTKYLTFQFDNPNLTGLFLICFYVIELYRLFSPENWKRKTLHIVMAVFIGYFVFETQSRNSLIVLIVVTLLCAWLFFRKYKKMHIGKKTAIFIAIFPAVFMWVYVSIINSEFVQNTFGFLVSIGKSLDSRLAVWEPAIENLISSPIIGAYSQISEGTGMSQMHNTHLDIACSYGILVAVLVCILLTKYLHQNGKIYTHKENFIYILGFACAIMLGMGEAALFSGGLGIYVFVGTFLMMAEKKDENPRIEK